MPDTRTISGDITNAGNMSADRTNLERAVAQVKAWALIQRRLLWAAKDAERLFACAHEFNLLSALPFVGVWGNLAGAIEAAQRALKAEQSYIAAAIFAIHCQNSQRGI